MKGRVREYQLQRYIKRVRALLTPSYLIRVGILAASYILAAKFGLSLAFSTKQVTTVWPPTGIAVAALLILGYRYWPGILLGAFIANVSTNESALIAGFIALGNTLEALTGTYLLRRVANIDIGFTRVADFLGLVVWSGAISTLVSATIGTSTLALGGLIPSTAYPRTWLTWWVGDMMGALIFAPLILVFARTRFAALRQKPVEAGLLLTLSIATCVLIFINDGAAKLSLAYLIFPIVIWSSLRFTQAGAAVVTTLVAAIAIWGTISGLGPFARSSSIDQNLILLHTFLLVIAVTAMLMAVTAAQKQQTEKALRSQTEKVTEANRRISSLLSGAANMPVNVLRTKINSKHEIET